MRNKAEVRSIRRLRSARGNMSVLSRQAHVVDFAPYLKQKRKQSARDALFLTVFLVCLSVFVVLV